MFESTCWKRDISEKWSNFRFENQFFKYWYRDEKGFHKKEVYFPVRKTLFDSLSVGKKIAVDFEFDMQSHLYQPKTVRLVK